MTQQRRVVITGTGLITPTGVGTSPTWENLLGGISGIRRITKFSADDFVSRIAGEVRNADEEGGFDVDQYISRKDQKKMGRFIHLGMAAAMEAVEQAGLVDNCDLEQVGVMLGSGVGGLPEIETAHATLNEKGPRRISPFFIPSILTNLLAGHASIHFGFKGPNNCVSTACATGAHAIGDAFRFIQRGEANAMVAGGAEACISPLAVGGFASAKALSTGFNETPEKACRPFDRDRDGFIIAEGAGVLVLEELEHARKRGAEIIAEVAGFGQTGDAYHMTSPSPDGSGGVRAMRAALKDAGMNASEVGYVNAHATSTPLGDEIESRAIEQVFGKNILVSSTKSMTGHMLGAAGSVEAAVCALALKNQKVPPTINLENPDENCQLDYVPNTARDAQITAALNNSFGFGGTNASLVLRKVS